MNKLKIIIMAVIILIIVPIFCFAESEEASPQLKLSYFGETIFHPGLSAGIESFITDGAVFDWLWGGKIGTYLHIRNHYAVFVSINSGIRLTAPFGLFFEIGGGAGCMLRVPAGTVYSADGDDIEEKLIITPAFIIPVSAGIGFDFTKLTDIPVAWFVNAEVFGEYPYNHYILPHLAVETGIRFSI